MVKVIAEVGSVHDGSFGNAQCLIEEVAKAGAWGVKFQHHIANEETTDYAPNPSYFKNETRKAYFERIAFTRDQWAELYSKAKALSLKFIVSPFSVRSLQEIEVTGVDIVKIASGEVTNTELLKAVKASKLKAILSSGMSTIDELRIATKILDSSLISLMQCTSEYPCKPENVGLNNIKYLKKISGTAGGFSDHTIGEVAAILAVGEGAEYIEKHVTFLVRCMEVMRHSMEIGEFSAFINDLKIAHKIANSKQDKDITAKSLNTMKKIFEKSIVFVDDFKQGHVIQASDLALKKPGDGLSSEMIGDIIGKSLARAVKYDEQVNWDQLKRK